jgi:hypothetical protein
MAWSEMAAVNDDQDGSGPALPRGPYWKTPYLYGEAEALNSMGTIAAPLLAGFSLAAMVQVLTVNATEARWPDIAFLLFLLAAVAFVGSVQAMFWARGYQVTPQEIKDWWPDANDDPQRMEQLRKEQELHAAGFRMWSSRGRVTYAAGLLCLLAALTMLAVPPGPHPSVVRWVTVGAGSAAFIVEAVWTAGSFIRPRRRPRWMTRLLEPPAR